MNGGREGGRNEQVKGPTCPTGQVPAPQSPAQLPHRDLTPQHSPAGSVAGGDYAYYVDASACL